MTDGVSLSLPALRLKVRLQGIAGDALWRRYAFLDPRLMPLEAGQAAPLVHVGPLDDSLREALSGLAPHEEVLCEQGGRHTVYFQDGYHAYRITGRDAEVRQCAARPGPALNAALVRAFALQGVMVVHALAFHYRGQGFLALGDSGAGKSTLALAVLLAGGRIVSDDLVLFGIGDDGQATALPFRADLVMREDMRQRLDLALRGRGIGMHPLWVGGECKWRVPREACRDGFITRIRVDSLLMLNRPGAHGDSRVTQVDQALAGARLIKSNYFLNRPHPLERAALLACLPELLSAVGSHCVEPGTDLLDTPTRALSRLLKAC